MLNRRRPSIRLKIRPESFSLRLRLNFTLICARTDIHGWASAVRANTSMRCLRQKLPDLLEHAIEHRLGQPAGERVLLAGVVTAHKPAPARQVRHGAVAKLRHAAGVPGDAPQFVHVACQPIWPRARNTAAARARWSAATRGWHSASSSGTACCRAGAMAGGRDRAVGQLQAVVRGR